PPPVDPAYADAVIGRWSWYDSRKAVAELGYRIRPLAEIVGRAVQEARRRNARTHGLGGRRVAIADGPEARPPLLITGVPGWLGNRFVDAFVNGLPDGVPLPRRRVRLLVEPRHLDLLDLPAPFEIVPGDLLDRASLDRALRGIGAVYHLAGAIHPPRTAALHRINGEGTRGLIDACAAAGVRRVLMMSTDAVAGVGTRDRRIFDEATPDRPWGDYGVSKQAGERALLEATRAGRIDGTSLRGFWFFGDFAPPRQEGFLKMMGWRRQIVFGDGRNLRNVSLTCNLVRAFVMAETVPRTIGRWYWIGDARADYTVDEIYRTLCDGAGRPYRPLRVPGAVCALARVVDRAMARAGRLHPTIHGMGKFDRDITGTIDAARRDFGYAPVLSLAEWAARQGAR
ncbi:MAG: NAD-dependent epimerase/dehydratase family protein, partial [Alphaproteobacteria bacterium]